MRNRQHSTFTSVSSEGALLPIDVLQRIANFDPELGGMRVEEYYNEGEKLNEVISSSWSKVLRAWQKFQHQVTDLPESQSGITQTRELWLLPLFSELGYGRLFTVKPLEVAENSYPISHGWQHVPIHLVSFRTGLDQLSRGTALATGGSGNFKRSPSSLVQELLNRSSDHLWGIVSNGLQLRMLRKNVSLTRQVYVEFDLEAMLRGELYADFVLLWLLCHQSRFEAERPGDCWLEKWSRLAQDQGMRLLNKLRDGVETAINTLGAGYLAHPANQGLRQKLRDGLLSPQDYYRQVLRFVYRMIVLFVAEDRDVLFAPDADDESRSRYTRYYSTARLRRHAELRLGTRHSDLYQVLWLVMEQIGGETGSLGCPGLGLPSLNGFLFSAQSVSEIVGCQLTNHDLLTAVRSLSLTFDNNVPRHVDYKNIGSEELGSVYESLLELHPEMNIEARTFALTTASGNERKTSGSYYTPTSLIDCLLDSALDPVLEEACKGKPKTEAIKAILDLKVCDPACGSGHFLIAAAHRIARRLAAISTDSEEPDAQSRRAALRDVVGHCIYGVDINPMSVELCKVNLWMEAIEPGKPLSFLDAHIQCGNSLLGSTPALLRSGIPDSAFNPIEGDDKKICSEFKKKNKQYRESGQLSLFDEEYAMPWDRLGNLAASMIQMEEMDDDTVEAIHRKEEEYNNLITSSNYENGKLLADAWCAAFVWKKNNEFSYPITQEIFRQLEQSPYNIAGWMKDEIKRLARQYQFFHWHLAFPKVFRLPSKDETPENEQVGWSGGFDVVLGNPPWERIKIQEKEWFASRKPTIANAANAAQRKRMITQLQYDDPDLYSAFYEDQRQATGESHIVRDSSLYPLCGRGDVNTYAIFAENMRHVISLTGRVGCIVPSGVATDNTTQFFFRDLTDSMTLVSLFSFINEAKLFPGIDHRVSFALLTISGNIGGWPEANFAFGVYRTEDLQQEDRHFSLSSQDIALLNPNTRTCPIFRSKRDKEITLRIYENVPVLIKEGPLEENPWNIKFASMFHMANDSHLFRSREQLEKDGFHLVKNLFCSNEQVYLPLYEAKMINTFNHRFGTYDNATKEELARGKLPEMSIDQLDNSNNYPLPNYWVSDYEVEKVQLINAKWSLGFRCITSSNLLRTFIGSIIPYVASGHSMAIMKLTQSDALMTLLFSR